MRGPRALEEEEEQVRQDLYIYIYIYICVYVYIYIYIYILGLEESTWSLWSLFLVAFRYSRSRVSPAAGSRGPY